jgi:hypothetical protein
VENITVVPQNIITIQSSISTSGLICKKIEISMPRDICSLFIAELFTIVKTYNQLKYPSVDEQTQI